MEKKVDYNQIVKWIESQGIAIVILIAACVSMYLYFTKEINSMRMDYNREISVLRDEQKDMRATITTLNDKLLECERQKIYIVHPKE